VDSCEHVCHGMLAKSSVVYGRNKTPWKYFSSSLVGRTSGHNVFTDSTSVPTYKNFGTYDSRKHFIPEVNLHAVVKYNNEEAHRRENDFDLNV